MKTVQKIGEVVAERHTNEQATRLVSTGKYQYCPKSIWKKARGK